MFNFKSDSGFVKYVKVNGEYRFAASYQSHKSLLQENEIAQSAGFFSYDTDESGKRFMRMSDESSMSLKWLGPDDDDGPNIAKLLNYVLIGGK